MLNLFGRLGGPYTGGRFLHIFEEDSHSSPEQKPDGCHDPPGTREPIEDYPISVGPKANPVKQPTQEGSKGDTGRLTDDEVRSKGCTPTNPNDAWIRTVLLRVHQKGERGTRDDAPDEDQVEKVCLECKGMAKVPNDSCETTDVQWNLVTS